MRPAALLTILALALATLAGCAPATARQLPEGVDVSIYQTRTDVPQRRMEVSIHNGTSAPLIITGLRLESEQFVSAATWAKDSTSIPAGATVDLPVQLSAADCDAVDPVHWVDLSFEQGSTAGSAWVAATDRLDRMPALRSEDCLQQAVAEVAELTITTAPRMTQRGGIPVIEVDLTVEPTGGTGEVTLGTLSSTTLLTPVDEAGLPVPTRELAVTIDGDDSPATVTLVLAPGRCDPHAIAEDKRGTIMPIDVRVGDLAGRIFVPASDAVRGALYAAVTAACA
jgi:hypothetical protein